MAVAGLVLGILSVSVFFWAGPVIGGIWSATAALTGNAGAQPAWPIWVTGLGLGVGVPVIALVLSILGLKDKKGIAIVGIVTSFVAVVLGFVFTAVAALAVDVASAAKDKLDVAMPDIEQMQNTLDDPAFQERMKKAMEAAAQQQDGTAADPNGAAGSGTPNVLMPGQTPPSPAPEALPAEAPPEEAPKAPSGP